MNEQFKTGKLNLERSLGNILVDHPQYSMVRVAVMEDFQSILCSQINATDCGLFELQLLQKVYFFDAPCRLFRYLKS